MKNKFVISFIFVILSLAANAQTFITEENDTTLWSEYYDGRVWAYRKIGDFVVGMTNYREKDAYGQYYQIAIFIKNLGDTSVTFDPENVTSTLYNKRGNAYELKIYAYDRYMKKVKTAQAWSMALLGFSADNMAATMQMITIGKLMENERNLKSQGYLKITTIHPDEGIIGYMNIKRKKGQVMTVNIPVNGETYSFKWDLAKKKK